MLVEACGSNICSLLEGDVRKNLWSPAPLLSSSIPLHGDTFLFSKIPTRLLIPDLVFLTLSNAVPRVLTSLLYPMSSTTVQRHIISNESEAKLLQELQRAGDLTNWRNKKAWICFNGSKFSMNIKKISECTVHSKSYCCQVAAFKVVLLWETQGFCRNVEYETDM